ncbi:MAG: dihydropteroate synthase [Bacteroidota bacterium]
MSTPRLLGILNITPDSFSDGGLFWEKNAALDRVGQMLEEGADIIDIGAYSSRPNAIDISVQEETERLMRVVPSILDQYPDAIISIDTFRAEVAERMLEAGAHLINDISGGELDLAMWPTIARWPDVPYILMHMKGHPQNMQTLAQYDSVIDEVQTYFVQKINAIRQTGIKDVIIDPGFGFGKKISHNYQLLAELERLILLDLPLLVGISRKSMLYKVFNTDPAATIPAASALHFQALQRGAHFLRVHDVAAAKQVVDLFAYMKKHGAV